MGARILSDDDSTLSVVGQSTYMDGVSLEAIAEAAGTPAYVYSAATIRRQYTRLANALAAVPHRIHYSVKACSNLSILRLLKGLGAGVDIVSGGELYRSRVAGYEGSDIVFSGVGKTHREINEALDAGVLFINVESEGELALVNRIAAERGTVAPVALRVNPEVTVDSPHEYIRTGEKGDKFGIPFDDVHHVVRSALSMPAISLVGLDMHIGSQLSTFDPFAAAMSRIGPLIREIRAMGADSLEWLDIGGGLAVTYDEEDPTDLNRFAAGLAEAVAGLGVRVVLEPGRFLAAESGVLLTRVLFRKRSGGRNIVIVDAAMNDLIRPSLYDAFHRIEPVAHAVRGVNTVDIVGPVCESGDFLALDRDLPDVNPGELLTVSTVGAYGYSMASNYNSRPRPAEVLVDDGRFAVISAREDYADLVRLEQAALEWRIP